MAVTVTVSVVVVVVFFIGMEVGCHRSGILRGATTRAMRCDDLAEPRTELVDR